MILLQSIELKDFLSHKNTKIDFYPDQKVLISGNSGAGKSAIIDALIWCFYGRGRSDNRSLINLQAKESSIIVTLSDDANCYKIERTITKMGKHGLQIYEQKKKSFEPVTTGTLKETQEFIERNLLHASYFLFINSIAYPQNNPESFVKQTATKRKELILEIIKAENYDEYGKRTKEILNNSKHQKEIIEIHVADNQKIIETEAITVQQLPELEQRDLNLKQKIQTINEEIAVVNELESKEREHKMQIQGLKDSAKTIKTSVD